MYDVLRLCTHTQTGYPLIFFFQTEWLGTETANTTFVECWAYVQQRKGATGGVVTHSTVSCSCSVICHGGRVKSRWWIHKQTYYLEIKKVKKLLVAYCLLLFTRCTGFIYRTSSAGRNVTQGNTRNNKTYHTSTLSAKLFILDRKYDIFALMYFLKVSSYLHSVQNIHPWDLGTSKTHHPLIVHIHRNLVR